MKYFIDNIDNLIIILNNNDEIKDNLDNNILSWISFKIICNYNYNKKYNKHSYTFWYPLCIHNYHFEDLNDNNYIVNIDFTINSDNIKIDYFEINKHYLNKLTKALFKFIYNIAKKNKINVIIKDVYFNLIEYNNIFADENFILTEEKCNNPFWIMSKKEIDINNN